jgi:hypothetical protein
MFSQRTKALWIALLSLVLSGCTVELAYNNLDRLVLRWLNEKIELTPQQQEQVKQALDEHLAWHCEAHLPAYADLLNAFQNDLSQGSVTHERMLEYGDTMAGFGKDLVTVTRPTAIELLRSLSDAQVTALQASFEESNNQLIEQLSQTNPDDVINERANRMSKRLARFMGKPSQTQRVTISQWARNYQSTAGFQLAYAYQWQAKLVEALSIRQLEPAAFEAQIEILFDPGAGWDEAYRTAVMRNQSATWEMMARVMSQLSDRQKNRMVRKIAGYSGDFEGLSCQADQDFVYSSDKKEAPSGSLSRS